MTITINGQVLTANLINGVYMIETSIGTPGLYNAVISYEDEWDDTYTETIVVQVLIKENVKVDIEKDFMWIFSKKDFSVKKVVELTDYEVNIDEETNSKSIVNVMVETGAESGDIVCIKQNGNIVYWGIVDEIQNQNGAILNQFILKYITNLFDRRIALADEEIIRTTGIEDFLAQTIRNFFTESSDTLTNIDWLTINVLSHTPKQTSVTNVENEIYNFHTWLTNCTQNYNIVYSFEIVNEELVMNIENLAYTKELLDSNGHNITNYTEVYETDVTAKVIVLYNKVNNIENPGTYILYLKTDRTTTTNINDPDRADGKIETVFTENYEYANQTALDVMKANSYNHNITFNLDKYIKVGTPIAIKTKTSIIYDTYISSIKMTHRKFYEYMCGNIRINFIKKLLKEKRDA